MKIQINPKQRDDFDNTPNEDRSEAEIAKWWDVPFIRTVTFEENQADADYDAWFARLTSYGHTDLESREQWQAQREQWRANWYSAFPSGTRYEVRCLDGGCWDRSTSWGMFATLEQALACAGSGPDWKG